MSIDTDIKVSDLIEEAQRLAATGYREIALDILLEARRACQPNAEGTNGKIYWEGLASVCYAEAFYFRHHRSTLPQAIAAYEESLECMTTTLFQYDHFDERPGRIEEALWQIFAINLKLHRYRDACKAARRALDGVSYPEVPGKPFKRVRVLDTRRLLTLTLFAGFC